MPYNPAIGFFYGLFDSAEEPNRFATLPSLFDGLPRPSDSVFSPPSDIRQIEAPLNCTLFRPPDTTWPFLSQPLKQTWPADAPSEWAKEIEAELVKSITLEHETWRLQRELKYAFHMVKSHEYEWLQDDAKAEELEDALYDGKWRPSHKVANRLLMDTILKQEKRNKDLIWSHEMLQNLLKDKDMELAHASKMEHDLSDRNDTIRELEQKLQSTEEDRKKYQQDTQSLFRATETNARVNDNLFKQVGKMETLLDQKDELIRTLSNRKDELLRSLDKTQDTLIEVDHVMEDYRKKNQEKTLALEGAQKALEKAGKGLEKAQKALTARDRTVVELNEKISAHEKKYNELEKDIKVRERDVRVREDAVKAQEHELKAQSRGAKEATKETGKELKTVRTQLKTAEANSKELEKKIQSAADEYQILKLDYESAVSELEALKATGAPEQKTDEKMQEELRKLKEERDKFRGLYETARTNEPIIQDRIARAVRLAKAETTTSLNTQFEVWKSKTKQVIHSADEMLQEAEAKTTALEKEVTDICVEAQARIFEVLKDTDERIRDLSRAKLGLVTEIGAKDAENSRLKQQLAALGYVV